MSVTRMAPAVEMRGIARRFGSVQALRGADFSCGSGEVHALLGENGAGKSTLMRVLCGLVEPDAGETLIRGREVCIRSPRDAMAAGILAGGALVLAQAGTFAERMTAGRGFIAVVIVVLRRWHSAGVFAAALLFGAASALQFTFQAVGMDVPYQLFLMVPYLVTLAVLAVAGKRAVAPDALGKAYVP